MGVLLGACYCAAGGQFKRLPQRPAHAGPIHAGRFTPERAVVDHAVGLGEGEHREAVLVHAVVTAAASQESGVGILVDDHASQGLADRYPIGSEIGVLTRSQKNHDGHPRDAGPDLAVGPGTA